jgi:hypothetical protein
LSVRNKWATSSGKASPRLLETNLKFSFIANFTPFKFLSLY